MVYKTSVPNQGDPCACGSVDTWHPECYARDDGREAKIQKLRALMAEVGAVTLLREAAIFVGWL